MRRRTRWSRRFLRCMRRNRGWNGIVIRLRTLQVNSTKGSAFLMESMMIYGAVVLMVICLNVLSPCRLLDMEKHRYRFGVLRKLGADEKTLGTLVLGQAWRLVRTSGCACHSGVCRDTALFFTDGVCRACRLCRSGRSGSTAFLDGGNFSYAVSCVFYKYRNVVSEGGCKEIGGLDVSEIGTFKYEKEYERLSHFISSR